PIARFFLALNVRSDRHSAAFRHWPFAQRAWYQALQGYKNSGTHGHFLSAARHVFYKYHYVHSDDKVRADRRYLVLPPSQERPNAAHPKSFVQIARLSVFDRCPQYAK